MNSYHILIYHIAIDGDIMQLVGMPSQNMYTSASVHIESSCVMMHNIVTVKLIYCPS